MANSNSLQGLCIQLKRSGKSFFLSIQSGTGVETNLFIAEKMTKINSGLFLKNYPKISKLCSLECMCGFCVIRIVSYFLMADMLSLCFPFCELFVNTFSWNSPFS